VDRKSRMGEPIILAKPFVSLFGGIQPAMLGELRGCMEDGLMDRFLFAYPAPRHVHFTEKEIGAGAEERYGDLYRRLSDLRLVLDRYGDPNPKPLRDCANRSWSVIRSALPTVVFHASRMSLPTMMIAFSKAIQKSMIRPSLSVHHTSFLCPLYNRVRCVPIGAAS
jgi:hypothetical protein